MFDPSGQAGGLLCRRGGGQGRHGQQPRSGSDAVIGQDMTGPGR